jgi:hypothetical protein
MQAIEKRIAALEQASRVRDRITVVWRVRTDQPDAEIHRITADDGEVWARQPGESEAAFEDRAILAVKRNASWSGWLIAD